MRYRDCRDDWRFQGLQGGGSSLDQRQGHNRSDDVGDVHHEALKMDFGGADAPPASAASG
jgi:hypothetical protein